jgi:hypothetical protein
MNRVLTTRATTALRLVERPAAYREELELLADENSPQSHSLHNAIAYPGQMHSEIAAYFIKRFTQRGDTVLDAFCGSGTTALESHLLGRISLASDVHPMAARLTTAKLYPADLMEVTLWLQRLMLRRPINIDSYRTGFQAFYDLDTYRELLHLRSALRAASDRISSFIELVALSLLHGHSAGYFSVYTFPQVSLEPSEQEQLNIRRAQHPDYRAVVPRILRKTASMLRDGWPSAVQANSAKHRIWTGDPRRLQGVPAGTVSLGLSSLPLPGHAPLTRELWLKLWFAGISLAKIEELFADSEPYSCGQDLNSWLGFYQQYFTEAARVVAAGGHLVLGVRQVRLPLKGCPTGQVLEMDQIIAQLVEDHLGRYWELEGVLLNTPRNVPRVGAALRLRHEQGVDRRDRFLVLRRR